MKKQRLMHIKCYYVNEMLSMPGATGGLMNIFEVDRDSLKINENVMQNDIEKIRFINIQRICGYLSYYGRRLLCFRRSIRKKSLGITPSGF